MQEQTLTEFMQALNDLTYDETSKYLSGLVYYNNNIQGTSILEDDGLNLVLIYYINVLNTYHFMKLYQFS